MKPVSSAMPMKSPGGTRPRCGCCQRTSASKPTSLPSLSCDDGLVMQQELALGQRAPHVALEVQARLGEDVHGGAVEFGARLPQALGLEHREVGVAQHVFGIAITKPAVCHADAGAAMNRLALDIERFRKCGEHVLGLGQGPGLGRDTLDQHHELVTAKAGQHVDRRARCLAAPPENVAQVGR